MVNILMIPRHKSSYLANEIKSNYSLNAQVPNNKINNWDYLRTLKTNTIIGWVLVAVEAEVRYLAALKYYPMMNGRPIPTPFKKELNICPLIEARQ